MSKKYDGWYLCEQDETALRVQGTQHEEAFLQSIYHDPVKFAQAVFAVMGWHRKAPMGQVEHDFLRFLVGDKRATPLEGVGYRTRRRVALGYRSLGKTHMVACVALWRLYRDRQRCVLVVAKSTREAEATVRLIRRCIGEVWFVRHLLPNDGEMDNSWGFVVPRVSSSRQPSVKALGVMGNLEGNRAHTIIADDCETKENSQTVEAREKLRKFLTELINIVYQDRPENTPASDTDAVDPVEVIYIGTPKHEDSLYFRLVKEAPADAPVPAAAYPFLFPSVEERTFRLAPLLQRRLEMGLNKPGDPITPMRTDAREIAERRSVGLTEFLREFMLVEDLAQSQRYPLRPCDFIVVDHIDPERGPASIQWGTSTNRGSTAHNDVPIVGFNEHAAWHGPIAIDERYVPYAGTRAAIDPAGRGNDHTGLAIVSECGGKFYVKHVGGIEGGWRPDVLARIARTLRYWRANDVVFEGNMDGSGAMEAELRSCLDRHAVKPGAKEDASGSPITDPSGAACPMDFPDGWRCQITRIHNTGRKEDRINSALAPLLASHRIVISKDPLRQQYQQAHHSFQWQITHFTGLPKCLAEDAQLDALAMALSAWNGAFRKAPSQATSDAEYEKHMESLMKRQREAMDRLMGKEPPRPRWHGDRFS